MVPEDQGISKNALNVHLYMHVHIVNATVSVFFSTKQNYTLIHTFMKYVFNSSIDCIDILQGFII